MNFDEFVRYRSLLAAAVGAGVVLGTAGVFLYRQFFADRRRMMLQREVAKLGLTVAEMKRELESLRKANCCKHSSRRNKNSTYSEVDSDFEMHSALDINSSIDPDDLEEFFDFSDEEDILKNDPDLSPELLQIYSNVDNLMKGDEEEKSSAYAVLLEYLEQYPENVGLLWRLAKICHMMGTSEKAFDKRKEYIMQGCAYAQRALEADGSNSEAHKWYAITIGSRGEFVGIQEKISDGLIFREHVDKALQINPNDATLYHLLGRFKYEVAILPWIKRVAAKKLFPDFPVATFQEALTDFLKAEELSSVPWKENRLLIAKCYISEDDIANAMQWLDLAAKPPATLPEDEAADQEIQDLLTKYN